MTWRVEKPLVGVLREMEMEMEMIRVEGLRGRRGLPSEAEVLR